MAMHDYYDLYDIVEYCKSTGQPLLSVLSATMLPGFMAPYADGLYASLDHYIGRTRGIFTPVCERFMCGSLTIEQVLNMFRLDVNSLIMKNQEKYQRLYDLMGIQYEPLQNYNMVEEGTDNRTLDMTDENTYGAVKKDNSYGATELTSQYGNRKTTENIGAVDNTDDIGAQANTTTSGVEGYNSSTFSDSDQEKQQLGARQDKHQEAARVNTTGSDAYQDVQSGAARSDSETVAHEAPDMLKHGGTDNNVHKLTRSGNIGVTTSQQMAQSEIDLWTAFNFYDILINDIVKEFTYLRDTDAYEPFQEGGTGWLSW